MKSWISVYKSYLGISASITLFNRINFYIGHSEYWGIGFNVNFYDRSITFEILNLYAGVEIYREVSKDG